jgi:predicted phage replisome organizer
MNEVFWVRLFCAGFEDPRWLAIEQLPDADAVQIIYVRMVMLAGRSNADGLFLLHESLPYDVVTLAAVLRRSVPIVQFALTTLERFRFIEVVDNIIAVTEWDSMQATDELARLAARREKDKLRKQTERAERRRLLVASADMSTDSPRMSWTTEIELDSYKTTTAMIRQPGEDVVVCGEGELKEVLALIPTAERNKRLMAVIGDAVSRFGEAVTMSNIRYALATHDSRKGRLGGLICAAVKHDYARVERESEKAKKEAAAAARVQREHAESAKKEQEERERREALAHQAKWLSLPVSERVELARLALERNPWLPGGESALETVLDDTSVPVTKALASMYGKGELSLASDRDL